VVDAESFRHQTTTCRPVTLMCARKPNSFPAFHAPDRTTDDGVAQTQRSPPQNIARITRESGAGSSMSPPRCGQVTPDPTSRRANTASVWRASRAGSPVDMDNSHFENISTPAKTAALVRRRAAFVCPILRAARRRFRSGDRTLAAAPRRDQRSLIAKRAKSLCVYSVFRTLQSIESSFTRSRAHAAASLQVRKPHGPTTTNMKTIPYFGRN